MQPRTFQIKTFRKCSLTYGYYSEEDFLKTVMEENYYGVPMVVNVFRDEDGQTIPLDFVQDFDPLSTRC